MRPAWGALDPRTPVVAGVGVASQQVDEPGQGAEALELMRRAACRAGEDAGAPALLREVGRIAVPQGTWPYADPARLLGRFIGAPRARSILVAAGIPQQTLLNQAYAAIREGQLDAALIVGGEAARRAALASRHGVALVDTVQDDVQPDEVQLPADEIVSALEIEAGIVSAMEPYALIDSALRAAEGRSLAAHRDEIAALYAGLSAVASGFPHAAFPSPRDAGVLREPGSGNRPCAFPYNKWHCSQLHVDQAAAILVCSLDAAERAGVDPARIVFPLVALESSQSVPVSARRDLHRWPAMEALGQAASTHLGSPLTTIERVELYSCFPAAVRVQQRALGLPTDGIPSITGGMSFAGGPWNNFVLQATAAMVEAVRREPGLRGLVSTVSGFLNKPGLAVYGTAPPRVPVLLGDLAGEARRRTARCEVVGGYVGPARVVAYTVTYAGLTPQRCLVIADTPQGRRCIAAAADTDLARRATEEELIGTEVAVDGGRFRV